MSALSLRKKAAFSKLSWCACMSQTPGNNGALLLPATGLSGSKKRMFDMKNGHNPIRFQVASLAQVVRRNRNEGEDKSVSQSRKTQNQMEHQASNTVRGGLCALKRCTGALPSPGPPITRDLNRKWNVTISYNQTAFGLTTAHYSTSWTLCGFRYGGIILRYLRSPFDTACIDANFLGTKSSESGFCNFRCFRKANFFVSSDLECFSVCIDTVRISNNVRLQDSNFWQSNFLS